jgi:glucan phosphoethanolaminetransferase (alkaline phosphatase superfamily)
METIISRFNNGRFSQPTTYLLLSLFSLGVDRSFGYCLRVFYPLTLLFILLLLLQFSRPLYIIVTLLLTFMSALYFPIGRLFGDPNYNALLSAVYTNPEEAQWFLINIPIHYYLGSLFLLLLGIMGSRFHLPTPFKKQHITFMMLFVLTSIFYKPFKTVMVKGVCEITEIGFTPVRFLREGYIAACSVRDDHKKIKEALTIKDTWTAISATPKYRNYILVIGESERKDLRHHYGFSIKNTPFATAAKGIFFDNYLSAGPSTVLSLTNTLAKRHQDELQLHNNIISLAKKAGFYTYWISNQHYCGENDTPISVISKRADSPLFVKMVDPVRLGNAKDTVLLPFIQSALADTTTTQPKLIVVHLIGSHPPFKSRTGNQFEVYFHSTSLSHYIQSILNTDRLLENITTAAKSTGDSWSLLYFSDHGLALENKLLQHSDKYQENYRVPLFIISSDDTQRENITVDRSALHFPILFSQWSGIQEPSLQSSCRYLSNTLCQDQTSVILANKTKTDISRLLLNPIKN